jgi:hypothetical protein
MGTGDKPVPASNISSLSSEAFLGLWVFRVYIVQSVSAPIRYSMHMVY